MLSDDEKNLMRRLTYDEKLSKNDDLQYKISELKEKRDQLNAEVGNHIRERNRINEEVRIMVISVKQIKASRDKYNSLVRELKEERKILDEELKKLRKKDYEAAGYTSRKQIPKDKINAIESEKTRKKSKEQERAHNSILEPQLLGNDAHSRMMEISAKVDILRTDADNSQKALITTKKEADKVHVEYLTELKKKHFLEKLLTKERKIRESKEEE